MKSDEILSALDIARYRGLTVKEVCAGFGVHHGQGSAALSHMHQKGQILRLEEKRDRASIYVLPQFAEDRSSIPPKRTGDTKKPREDAFASTSSPELLAEVESLRAALDAKQEELGELRREADAVRARATDLHDQVEAQHKEMADVAAAAKRATADAWRQEADSQKELFALKEKMEGAVTTAREEGEAEGWTVGYDAGVTAGRTESMGAAQADLMIETGVEKGRLMEMEHIDALAGAIVAQIKHVVPVRAHHSTCHLQHPECALRSIRRSIAIRRQQIEAGRVATLPAPASIQKAQVKRTG